MRGGEGKTYNRAGLKERKFTISIYRNRSGKNVKRSYTIRNDCKIIFLNINPYIFLFDYRLTENEKKLRQCNNYVSISHFNHFRVVFRLTRGCAIISMCVMFDCGFSEEMHRNAIENNCLKFF